MDGAVWCEKRCNNMKEEVGAYLTKIGLKVDNPIEPHVLYCVRLVWPGCTAKTLEIHFAVSIFFRRRVVVWAACWRAVSVNGSFVRCCVRCGVELVVLLLCVVEVP